VRQEAWALLIVNNITATLAARTAAAAGLDPDRIPFTAVLSLIRGHVTADACCRHYGKRPASGNNPIALLITDILAEPRHRENETGPPGGPRSSGRTGTANQSNTPSRPSRRISRKRTELPATAGSPCQGLRRNASGRRAEQVALFRYRLIRDAADPALSTRQRGRMVREIASRAHEGPFGDPVIVSRGTVDRWIRAWRESGFTALAPPARQVTPRTDAATPRTLAGVRGPHRRGEGTSASNRRRHIACATGAASAPTPLPTARPARHGQGRPAPWPAVPRSAGPMPGSASSYTSKHRNRPVCRTRSSLAFLSVSSAVATLVPSLGARHRGLTDPASREPSEGRGKLALNRQVRTAGVVST
jgi:hypothetical protein